MATSSKLRNACSRTMRRCVAFEFAKYAASASLLLAMNPRIRSVMPGAPGIHCSVHNWAEAKSSPRNNSDSGWPRASHRPASSPSLVCSRIQSTFWRSPSANCVNGRVIPTLVSKRTNCRRRNCVGMSDSGAGLKITGNNRFDFVNAVSTSQAQRSDFTASGDTTNTIVSACWISPPRRASQSSPTAIS